MSSSSPARYTYPDHLPVSAQRHEIAELLLKHQVIVVAGETGSGKTTQLPKIALELGFADDPAESTDPPDSTGPTDSTAGPTAPGHPKDRKIIGHTQPRRIAARSVAERIAEELGEEIGETVGYQVRFTSDVSARTRLKLMTDGILLAEIQHDPQLSRYSVIIIDEAHERSLNIDFLLGYLKRLLPSRPDLKVIITSATIDVASFAEHFADPATGEPAPIVEVSGRTYPVEIRYRPLTDPHIPDDPLDDADDAEEARDPIDAVADAVEELAAEEPGDILAFFPGEREIRDAAEVISDRIRSIPRLARAEVLPLYGRLTMDEQQRVFRPAKNAAPRIVLATNVAETSLTVPGIKYVIDTGTARISRYSQRTKVQRLPVERISQASAQQRSGRAGRTSPGIAIRLYSEEDFAARPEFTDPEILRTSLASVILHMLSTGVAKTAPEVENFPFLQPPEHRQITDGIRQLEELGALNTGRPVEVPVRSRGRGRSRGQSSDRTGQKTQTRIFTRGTITPIGRKLAVLPIDPRLGRMILAAKEHGAVAEVIVLASALTIQDPRERPVDQQAQADTAHARFSDENSDFSGLLNLWVYLRQRQQELSGNQFRKMCRAEFINYVRVREWQDLVRQLQQLAGQVGIKSHRDDIDHLDPVGKHEGIHRALLAGLLGHIGSYDGQRRDYLGARGTRFRIFPGSALFKKKHPFVMAAELVETSQLWGRQLARIEPDWTEAAAGSLAKSAISDPYWSRRAGAALAKERVTVYGVTVVADRTLRYERVNPTEARRIFIQHALVDGDWNTRHRFVARNRRRLEEIEELEIRLRRQDLKPAPHRIFEFFDARVPAEVVSGTTFDKWWGKQRHKTPDLLDFDPENLLEVAPEELDPALFPNSFRHPTDHGPVELPLTYEFRPRELGSDPGTGTDSGRGTGSGTDAKKPATDGVTVTIPLEILHQMDPRRFEWLIPGLREELVTTLIRGLPKPVRKHLVPAPDTAAQILPRLSTVPDPTETDPTDTDPTGGDFYQTLSGIVRELKGQVIDPKTWRAVELPEHLKMSFRVVDARGAIVGAGDDLAALQTRLAAANQTALADSLAAAARAEGLTTPTELALPTDPAAPKESGSGPGSTSPESTRPGSGRPGSGNPSPKKAAARKAGRQKTQQKPVEPLTGLTDWSFGELPVSVDSQIKVGSNIQTVTGYPALRAESTGKAGSPGEFSDRPSARIEIMRTAGEAALLHRGGVISLLHARLPDTVGYLSQHLNQREKLAFANSPHSSLTSLLQATTRAAIDSLLEPTSAQPDQELPRDKAAFNRTLERVRAEVIDRTFEVTKLVEEILAARNEAEKRIKKIRSLPMMPVLTDVREQLAVLVPDNLITAVPYAQLKNYPRYLRAISYRLDKLTTTGGLQQDVTKMATIHGLEEQYRAALAEKTSPGLPIPAALTRVGGLIQELRVSFFAQELGTAVSVSEKRVRTALREATAG